MIRFRALAIVLVAATCGTSLGAWMHPSDLQPGDQYRVSFVNSVDNAANRLALHPLG